MLRQGLPPYAGRFFDWELHQPHISIKVLQFLRREALPPFGIFF